MCLVEPHGHHIALLGWVTPIRTRDDGLRPTVDVGATEDEGLRTQLLDHIDLELQSRRDDLDVFRPNAEHHLGATAAGEDIARNRNDLVADPHSAVGDRGTEQVHRRGSHEPGDEDVRGSSVQLAR